MTDKGLASYCGTSKRDAIAFDKLVDELKSIQKDKQTISEMELSEEAKQKCYEDLDKQMADVKERMHNAIDEM
jgi:hypothetical protein